MPTATARAILGMSEWSHKEFQESRIKYGVPGIPTAIRCGGLYSCIEEFIVSEKARGKGVGGQLVQAIIAEAKLKGSFEIQINNPSKQGYPVYLRYGVKDIGKHLKMELLH